MAEKNRGRTKALYIRLYEEEWNILEHKAKMIGKSKSEFIRDGILLNEVQRKPIWQDENFKKLLSLY